MTTTLAAMATLPAAGSADDVQVEDTTYTSTAFRDLSNDEDTSQLVSPLVALALAVAAGLLRRGRRRE